MSKKRSRREAGLTADDKSKNENIAESCTGNEAQRPVILFAHGAGASSSSDWMQAWKRRLSAIGDVVTFDYPHLANGRRGAPPPLPKLIAAHRKELEKITAPGRPVILAGKSMGSRVGCHLSIELPDPSPVKAVVCFGYPLKGANGAMRDQVLRELKTPAFFIQGTRDNLCPLDKLRAVLATLKPPHGLHVVESGDHSLVCTKTFLKNGSTSQHTVDQCALGALETFLREQNVL